MEGRGPNETTAEWKVRHEAHFKALNEWMNNENAAGKAAGRKATTMDKWEARNNLGGTGKVVMGRKAPQSADTEPPSAHGAGKWKQNADGLWSSKSAVGQAKVKYAIKGEKSGEWMVAHILNSKSLPTREEIHGMLKQADSLQAKWPLTHRPELVIGDWTARKMADKYVAGFTYLGDPRSQKALIINNGLNVNTADIPVGNHVIFINSNEHNRYTHATLMSKGYLSPSYDQTNGWDYTVAHEYAHLRNFQKVDKNVAESVKIALLRGGTPTSKYGQSSLIEAHAEGFAEWVHSGGAPRDDFSRALAEILNWPKP